jgi:hypothetical protein
VQRYSADVVLVVSGCLFCERGSPRGGGTLTRRGIQTTADEQRNPPLGTRWCWGGGCVQGCLKGGNRGRRLVVLGLKLRTFPRVREELESTRKRWRGRRRDERGDGTKLLVVCGSVGTVGSCQWGSSCKRRVLQCKYYGADLVGECTLTPHSFGKERSSLNRGSLKWSCTYTSYMEDAPLNTPVSLAHIKGGPNPLFGKHSWSVPQLLWYLTPRLADAANLVPLQGAWQHTSISVCETQTELALLDEGSETFFYFASRFFFLDLPRIMYARSTLTIYERCLLI